MKRLLFGLCVAGSFACAVPDVNTVLQNNDTEIVLHTLNNATNQDITIMQGDRVIAFIPARGEVYVGHTLRFRTHPIGNNPEGAMGMLENPLVVRGWQTNAGQQAASIEVILSVQGNKLGRIMGYLRGDVINFQCKAYTLDFSAARDTEGRRYEITIVFEDSFNASVLSVDEEWGMQESR